MSNELEGDGALVEDLESLGPMASVGPYATETETETSGVAKFDEPAVNLKIMFQVTQIATVYVSCLSAVFVQVLVTFRAWCFRT